jgi:putative salt-induced outer membrane protein YdiY
MLCAFAALLLPAIALSQQPAQFKTTLNAGGTITDGNSKTRQANAALVTEGEKEGLGAVRAGVEANYGESTVGGKKDTTVNNARIFGGARKTLSKMTFASADVSALYDDVAKVDYRAMLGLGLGVYLVKNERTSLSVEAGPAYVWEKVSGVTDDYLALRFAERATHAISNTAKVWQSAEYLPKADDFGDYLLNAELGAEAAMNARMSLRLVLQDKYDSTPGEGLKKNDLTLIAGVGVKL